MSIVRLGSEFGVIKSRNRPKVALSVHDQHSVDFRSLGNTFYRIISIAHISALTKSLNLLLFRASAIFHPLLFLL